MNKCVYNIKRHLLIYPPQIYIENYMFLDEFHLNIDRKFILKNICGLIVKIIYEKCVDLLLNNFFNKVFF